MKISAKVDYACKALLELGMNWPNTAPVQINTIAKRQKIPIKFLTHILIGLKQMGLVQSIRGKNGGYVLIKPPKTIKLGDVIEHFDGIGLVPNVGYKKTPHVMSGIWEDVDRAFSKIVSELTFETICNKVRDQKEAVMYQI